MNLEKLFELNPLAVVWDGLDKAIVGMASKELNGPIIVTYLEEDELKSYEYVNEYIEDDEPIDRWGRQEFGPILAYDTDLILDILIEENQDDETDLGEKYQQALEHFEYNIDGAYVGEFTPLHLPMAEIGFEE